MPSHKQITVHCSNTPHDQNLTLRDIDKQHRAAGYARCCFHYVIRRDGTRESGRQETEASVLDHREEFESLSVCLVGREGEFTHEQLDALKAVSLDRDLPLLWRL